MKKIRFSLVSMGLLAAAASAHAQLFKCVGADGKTSYQSEACPTAAKEQRMNVQTGPSSTTEGGLTAGVAMKPGWDEREVIFSADVCAKSILEPARKEFDAQSQPFPDKQLTPQVERYCNCLARRASTSYTFLEYTKNPAGIAQRLAQEAYKGGPCKPEGLHAELLRKAGKM